MYKAILRFALMALLGLVANPIYAQRPKTKVGHTLGWDLSYVSVLERNRIERNEWIWKWLGRKYQSPVKPLIAGWRGEPIISSVLIESPAFHAGEHVTFWLVRTKDHAYYWEYIEGRSPSHLREPLSPQLYDDIFKAMSSWQQAEPLKSEVIPVGGVPGYIGFLSLYDRNESRQMLLSLADFGMPVGDNAEEVKEGRLSLALKPIFR